MRTFIGGVVIGAGLVGCKKVEPAPADLDGLLHWFWQLQADGTDEQLADGIRSLDEVIGADLTELVDGSLTDLSADEIALVGRTDATASAAAGVYMVNAFDCGREQLERILTYSEQDELYDGIYDSYTRSFDGDRDAFLDGTSQTLAWDVTYGATILGTSYIAELRSGVRRVPELDEEQSPFGAALVTAAWLTGPATFESDSKAMNQDYQVEIYYARSPGEILHAYGLWRQADFGSGFTSNDEGVQRLLLNSLADWDDTTVELCAEGRP